MAVRAHWAAGGTLTAALVQNARIAARWGGAGALAADAAVVKDVPPTATLHGQAASLPNVIGQANAPLTITGHR